MDGALTVSIAIAKVLMKAVFLVKAKMLVNGKVQMEVPGSTT